jgi:hypothetical protein
VSKAHLDVARLHHGRRLLAVHQLSRHVQQLGRYSSLKIRIGVHFRNQF